MSLTVYTFTLVVYNKGNHEVRHRDVSVSLSFKFNAAKDVGSIISASLFEQMLKHQNDAACQGKGFYTYDAFITAAKSFGGFGTTGDKKELAAFFGQTSHETTGGWDSAPDGRYSWGYCKVREGPNTAPSGYYGRGPIQLTHDYNYRQAGNTRGVDLLNNPDLVAPDVVISFKTATWFWMTAHGNKPSIHDVITKRWTPSAIDTSAGRVPFLWCDHRRHH